MKKKNIHNDYDLDLLDIFVRVWKEKNLVMFITIFFVIGGLILGKLQPINYTTSIVIRLAPLHLFENLKKNDLKDKVEIEANNEEKLRSTQFNGDFQSNLSVDTLVKFAEQNTKINEFKLYLKKNNIDIRQYFLSKFKPVFEDNIKHPNYKFSLVYHETLKGDIFLNEYIAYVKKITEEVFKQQLSQIINKNLKIYELHFEIAKEIKLEDPILKSMTNGSTLVSEPSILYFNGTKVLAKQIDFLKKSLDKNKNFNLQYNPIVQKALPPSVYSKSILFYVLIPLLTGLFISVILILLKSALKKKFNDKRSI